MENQVSYNTFYLSWHDVMEEAELTDEQYGRVSRAINRYCFYGETQKLSGTENIIFKMAVPNIDASNKAKREGKKGGKKSGEARRQADPNPPCGKNRSNGDGEGEGNVYGDGNGEEFFGSSEPPFPDPNSESILPIQNTEPLGFPDPPAAETSAKEGRSPAPKAKKPPLREREPENGHEIVEKAYRQNWDRLYAEGKVRTRDPVVNWAQARKLLSAHFAKGIAPEKIVGAIDSGLKDDFAMRKGYSLAMMLSATMLNGLLNSTGPPPKRRGGIAGDGASGDDWEKYFERGDLDGSFAGGKRYGHGTA